MRRRTHSITEIPCKRCGKPMFASTAPGAVRTRYYGICERCMTEKEWQEVHAYFNPLTDTPRDFD